MPCIDGVSHFEKRAAGSAETLGHAGGTGTETLGHAGCAAEILGHVCCDGARAGMEEHGELAAASGRVPSKSGAGVIVEMPRMLSTHPDLLLYSSTLVSRTTSSRSK